jgi:hypothetical protein
MQALKKLLCMDSLYKVQTASSVSTAIREACRQPRPSNLQSSFYSCEVLPEYTIAAGAAITAAGEREKSGAAANCQVRCAHHWGDLWCEWL